MKYQGVRDAHLKPNHWRVDVRPGCGTTTTSIYGLPLEFRKVLMSCYSWAVAPTHASRVYKSEARARKIADLATLSGLIARVTPMAMVEVLR